jgi:hypothetical protein
MSSKIWEFVRTSTSRLLHRRRSLSSSRTRSLLCLPNSRSGTLLRRPSSLLRRPSSRSSRLLHRCRSSARRLLSRRSRRTLDRLLRSGRSRTSRHGSFLRGRNGFRCTASAGSDFARSGLCGSGSVVLCGRAAGADFVVELLGGRLFGGGGIVVDHADFGDAFCGWVLVGHSIVRSS